MPYMSDELYHFVVSTHPHDDEANFQTLTKIIHSSCITYDPNVTGWGETRLTVDWSKSLLEGELVVPQMTCYCDIPFETDSVGAGSRRLSTGKGCQCRPARVGVKRLQERRHFRFVREVPDDGRLRTPIAFK